MRITHLLFWVQENKLSEKFYKKLGFSINISNDDHSVVALNGFAIELVSMRDEALFAKDSMTSAKGKGMYVYVAVENVDDMYHSLKVKGIVSATQPTNWSWGRREFVVKDPDGYKLCFWQPTSSKV